MTTCTLRSSIDVLKHCKSEQQRVDYHTALANCAVRRTSEDEDPDGMYARVAAVLGVTRFSR